MARGLPPLQPVPNLMRLLAPGEVIIYTAKLHPLFGWPWALMALVFSLLGFMLSSWFFGLGLVFLVIYALPFRTNEIAVSTQRLLLRVGRFRLVTEAFGGNRISDWRLHQSMAESLLHCGDLEIYLNDGAGPRLIQFKHVMHPVTFLEALETLLPSLRKELKA